MKFTKKDKEKFISSKFPWMGTRVITPSIISFTDNMYDSHWVITRESHNGDIFYTLSRKKKRGRKHKYIGYDMDIFSVLTAVEVILWTDVSERKPCLKRIPLSYILDTPERLGMMEELTLPFLFTMVPMKLEEDE